MAGSDTKDAQHARDTPDAQDTQVSDVVVGIDLGGTKIAGGLVGADGSIGPIAAVPTPAADGPQAVLDAVARLVRQVIADGGVLAAVHGAPDRGSSSEHGRAPTESTEGTQSTTTVAPGASVGGLGVGTAGVVDAGTGVVLSATDALPGWPGTDVRAGLQGRLAHVLPGGAVSVENDVDAHAGGEAWLGAAAEFDSVLMVAVGTGVGAGLVLQGRPWRGSRHVAGEIGHQPSPDATGLRCSCGRLGHVEAIGCGPALFRHYLRLGGSAAADDARGVVTRAESGEPTAVRAVTEAAAAIGRAIAGAVTVLDPAAVVLGGGLSEAGPVWWDPMVATARAELVEPLAQIPILPSALGQAAAILGAARTALGHASGRASGHASGDASGDASGRTSSHHH